jgi:cysteinyl-tRNA synthetase, unknown class
MRHPGVWELATGKQLVQFGESVFAVLDASFSPDGTHVIMRAGDKSVQSWSVTTGDLLFRLASPDELHGTVQSSSDGRAILTTSGNRNEPGYRVARLWDGLTATPLDQVTLSAINVAEFAPDSQRVAVATGTTATILPITRPACGGPCSSVEFASEGAAVLTASWGGKAQFWIKRDEIPLRVLEELGLVGEPGAVILLADLDHGVAINRAFYNSTYAGGLKAGSSIDGDGYKLDGSWHVATLGDDGTARLWQLAARNNGGKAKIVFELMSTIRGHDSPITHAAVTPDGRRLVTGDMRGAVRVTDLAQATQLSAVDPMPAYERTVAPVVARGAALARGWVGGAQRQLAALWSSPKTTAPVRLTGVKSWAYQLQNIKIAEIAALDADLAVIDVGPNGDPARPFSPLEVARMKSRQSGGSKKLVAYMSIGEAAETRPYWNKAWVTPEGRKSADAPGWLHQPNADGWSGAWKVKFWDPAWQAIILDNPDSELNRLIAQGFDGVYLDLVDSYGYWQQDDRGQGNRPTAPDDMINFVARIATHARTVKGKPDFLVIPQNGEALLQVAKYRNVVSAIGKEDLLFEMFGKSDQTPGVVKRKESGSEREDSVASLAAYLRLGLTAQPPIPVLGVEYLRDRPEDAALIPDAEKRLREFGIVPFFCLRQLDQLCPYSAGLNTANARPSPSNAPPDAPTPVPASKPTRSDAVAIESPAPPPVSADKSALPPELAALTDAEVAALVSPEARNKVIEFEVTSRAEYEKKYIRPEAPGGASGIILGIGYDVSVFQPDDIRVHWKGLLPDDAIERLVKVSVLKGGVAQKGLSDVAEISVPWDAAVAVYERATLPTYGRKVLATFPNALEIKGHAFGALFSLVYNRGTSLEGDRREEMRNIRDHMAARDFEKVPNELRAMRRLYQGQPELQGLVKRRGAEAVMFERGLEGPRSNQTPVVSPKTDR